MQEFYCGKFLIADCSKKKGSLINKKICYKQTCFIFLLSDVTSAADEKVISNPGEIAYTNKIPSPVATSISFFNLTKQKTN